MNIRPILSADLTDACAFMQATLTPTIRIDRWRSAFSQSWASDSPNHGYLMMDGGQIIGTLGCAYSVRQIRGQAIRFCNFSSWSVLPEHRGKGLLLLSAAMKQEGYIFTNFTPNPATIPIFDRLRFHQIDTTRWIVANSLGRIRSTIVNHDTLAAALSESDAEIYHAHRGLPGVHQVGLIGPGGVNLISFIHSRFRRIPCALVVRAGDWRALAENMTAFRKAALMHFGLPLTAIERRRLPAKPKGALAEQAWMPTLYRGGGVEDPDIDGLYSEIVTLTPLVR
jgi:hypothetical protein